ncbi:MAG TPA: peptide chain release factor N(5)-glutamine methyltransferase [Virgibacillus sp.]|nr:peptide chain release factor N(5)-glutamine methyltransferase [Virgibacillus sp.]
MKKNKKQFEVLQWASLFLEKNNCEQGIAEILLQHHLAVSRAQFYMMMQEPIPEQIMERFQADIQAHVDTGIPVQHLTGYEYFYGRPFFVNEHTLIPRPETEELVHQTIQRTTRLSNEDPVLIADIGTGSGVIAATLALELPSAEVYATDISEAALHVARKNAKQLEAEVTFLQGDFLQPLITNKIQADIIVSNPPYIALQDEPTLSRTVKDFDPHLSLFAKENGLAAYKKILQQSPHIIHPTGWMLVEIGYEQGEAVRALMKSTYPQSKVEIIQDINGLDRIVSVSL